MTTYFVSLVGKGVSLSNRDLTLVRQWEAAGLPAAAVCRALRTAVRQRRRREPVSISDCAATVARLVSTEPSSRPGDACDLTPGWTRTTLMQALVRVGRAADSRTLKEVYRELYRRVRALPDEALSVDTVSRLDEQTVSLILSGLSTKERSRLKAEVRREARALLGVGASGCARQRLYGSLLEGALRERFDLSLPSDLLIEEETP